jgi:hypothetical protein
VFRRGKVHSEGDRRPKMTPNFRLVRLPVLARSGRSGMVIVETIGWMRREHFVQGKTIRRSLAT